MYLSEYIEYLIKYHGLTRSNAEMIVEDVKPTIYWYEQIGKDVQEYLSGIVRDSYTYSETLQLI